MDAKRTILGLTQEAIATPEGFVTSVVNHILAGNGNKPAFIAQVRLQALCIAGNIHSLKTFLHEFTQAHGILATELLVNGYVYAGNGVPNCPPIFMTPILAAVLWNTDKEIPRLLYSYGASLEAGLDSTFPEEKVHAYHTLTIFLVEPGDLTISRCGATFLSLHRLYRRSAPLQGNQAPRLDGCNLIDRLFKAISYSRYAFYGKSSL